MTSRVWVAAASGLLGLLLAGCGTGQTAPTAQDLPSVPGVNEEDEGIAVRNAAVTFDPAGYEAGDTVPIELSIFNDTAEPVALTQATSPAAASVTVADDDLSIGAFDFVRTTLEVDGLSTPLDGTGSVPVELAFDNGARFTMNVPVAPPQDRTGEREPTI